MRKQLLIFATLCSTLLLTLLLPAATSAVNLFTGSTQPCSGAASSSTVCQDVQNAGTTNPIINGLSIAINIVSILIGIAAVIVIIISGMRLGLSGGDPNAVKTARNGIIYSLVGVAIAAAAQIIVIFVLNKIK